MQPGLHKRRCEDESMNESVRYKDARSRPLRSEPETKAHLGNRRWVLGLTGIGMTIFALSAGRLGLVGFPGLRIPQILLAVAGFCCAFFGLVIPRNGGRQWALRLARSQIALIVISTLAGLLLCEIISLGVEMADQQGNKARGEQTSNEMKFLAQPVADPKLELRLAPYAGGHDAKGFRNERVPDKVNIVAIGDSQTWGINASRSEAWPQTLSKISGRSVYNMGMGSYGTVHYWVLTDEALELSPKVIVVALFLGNDLWDAYRMVYSLGIYPQFRNGSANEELLNDTVASRYHQTIQEAKEFRAHFQKPASSPTWYDFLRSHSAFARVFYRRGIWPTTGRREYEAYQHNRAWAIAYPDKGVIYDKDAVRTVFMTSQHLLGLDLDDPRIAEGLRITKEMLLRIQAKTASANSRLLLLFIPTKELVYADAVKTSTGHLNATYARVVLMESRARAEIILLCKQNGIDYVDPVPALKDAIDHNEQIYPWTGDSHHTPRGYSVLASEVNKSLVRLGW
jgi:hypothetical protein